MTDFPFDAPTLAVSVGIIVLSFISEDAAAVSSALLVLGGPVAWPVGFVSCFLGIWAGDLGIYSAARWGGRPLLRSRWLARRINLTTVDRLAEKFARRAQVTLFVSRFLPGTRVVTYVAAGLFATPVLSFTLITGCAVFIWVAAIFGLTKLLGVAALSWFSSAQSQVASVIFVGLCAAGAFALLRKPVVAGIGDPGRSWTQQRPMGRDHRSRLQLLRRWAHWEFWPAWLFYLPVAAYYSWLGLRYRSFTLPSAANPVIPTGGLVGESKAAIIDLLQRAHPHHVADGYLIDGLTIAGRMHSLHRILRERGITLPFILKPDFGQRGNGVRLVRSMSAAREYLEQVAAPVMVQRYAPGPREVGIFYYRFPNESRGRIFSITEKIFPEIRGDGRRTIEQLILADPRASLIAQKYLTRFAARRDEVLATGEKLKLVESGNHAQGCIFRDGTHLWTAELEEAIDRISRLQGFHIGRYDIRYASDDDLRRGENFQIVELNGAASEATSIYDARNSLGQAYRTLFAQWRLVFAIGDLNRRRAVAMRSPCASSGEEWRKYSARSSILPAGGLNVHRLLSPDCRWFSPRDESRRKTHPRRRTSSGDFPDPESPCDLSARAQRRHLAGGQRRRALPRAHQLASDRALSRRETGEPGPDYPPVDWRLGGRAVGRELRRMALGKVPPFRTISIDSGRQRVTEWQWNTVALGARRHRWQIAHWFSSATMKPRLKESAKESAPHRR